MMKAKEIREMSAAELETKIAELMEKWEALMEALEE